MENNAGTLVNDWGTYEDGILTMNRSMGYHGTTCFAGQKFNLEANKTYTLSATVYLTGTNATSNVILGFAGESNPNVTITKEVWTKVSRTVTFTQYKENMRAFIQPSNTGNVLQIKEIMLCEGTDTNYSPYTDNPIELCKIGNYQDKLYYDSGKWYIEKNIKKLNLTDYKDVAWWKSGKTVKATWSFLDIDDILPSTSNNTPGIMMSSHFKNTYVNDIYNGTSLIGCAVGTDGLYFSNNEWTANDFKTYITNNTVYVYCALLTPTTTEITDTYLLEQLQALENIELYENLCYANWVGTKEPTMKLTYYVDTDKILEKLREE